VQNKFNYITTIEEIVDKRRLDWLGNVARQLDAKLLK
jgi:hypothetical protein